MSTTLLDGDVGQPGPPRTLRVRQQARDAVALMVFSATTSLGLAAALLFLTHLPARG